MEMADVEGIAGRVLRFAGRARDPRHLVVALGLRLLPRVTDNPPPRTIAYAWHPNARVVSRRVAIGLAGYLLREHGQSFGVGDVARLAELLNPSAPPMFRSIRKTV